MSEQAVEVRHLTKRYGEKTVLQELSLTFPRGEVTCIMGESGCGKTTLLRILAGLEQAEEGELLGIPPKIAFVFQEDRLCEDFSAWSNIRLVTGKGKSKKEIIAHLTELGLADDWQKPVKEMSGGMRRRVAIARAVCYEGELLILDEPFKGLDAARKQSVITYLKKYTVGKTVIYVTHDRSEAEALGGNVIELVKTKN